MDPVEVVLMLYYIRLYSFLYVLSYTEIIAIVCGKDDRYNFIYLDMVF